MTENNYYSKDKISWRDCVDKKTLEKIDKIKNKKEKCQICRREIEESNVLYSIFWPFTDAIYIPPQGKNYITCLECYLSHLAQVHCVSNQEMNHHLKLLAECEDYEEE